MVVAKRHNKVIIFVATRQFLDADMQANSLAWYLQIQEVAMDRVFSIVQRAGQVLVMELRQKGVNTFIAVFLEFGKEVSNKHLSVFRQCIDKIQQFNGK